MKRKLHFTVILSSIFFCSSAQSFQSAHFTIQKIADGIFAAIATNGGYGICNAGIIDLGEATLIFDPFMTPEAAEDLKKAAFQLTGHTVKYIVNSHYHNDHIGGNQVFTGATIISTQRTKELIAKYQPEEIKDDKTAAPLQLDKLKKINTSTLSPHALEENIMWKGYYEALVTSNDSLKTVLPDVTFNDRMTVSGTKRSVQLLCYGIGHTESDLFLYIPAEQIAFLGDLLFVQNQPWLGDGNPDKWRNYLDSIARLGVKILVPGHGPVGTVSDIDMMKLYFGSVTKTAISYYKNGTIPQNDSNLKSPPPFDNWFLSNFYKPNVIWEYDRMYKK